MGRRLDGPTRCGMAGQQPSSMLCSTQRGWALHQDRCNWTGNGVRSQAAGGLSSRWLTAQPHRCLTWVGGGQLLCKLGHARGLNRIHLRCPSLQAATVQADRPAHPSGGTRPLDTRQHSTWHPAVEPHTFTPPFTDTSCSYHRPQARPDSSCCRLQHLDTQHQTHLELIASHAETATCPNLWLRLILGSEGRQDVA